MLQLAIAELPSRVCCHRLIVVVVARAASDRVCKQGLAIVISTLGLATTVRGDALVLRLVLLGEGNRTNTLGRAGSRD